METYWIARRGHAGMADPDRGPSDALRFIALDSEPEVYWTTR